MKKLTNEDKAIIKIECLGMAIAQTSNYQIHMDSITKANLSNAKEFYNWITKEDGENI